MNSAENAGQPAGCAGAPGLPPVAGRAACQAEVDALRIRADQWRLARLATISVWSAGRPIAQWPRLAAGRSGDLGIGRN